MSIYPDELAELREACQRYRAKAIGIESFQTNVWKAVQSITAIEESDLRDALRQAEGQLELIQYTVDSNRLFRESLKVVGGIERIIEQHR